MRAIELHILANQALKGLVGATRSEPFLGSEAGAKPFPPCEQDAARQHERPQARTPNCKPNHKAIVAVVGGRYGGGVGRGLGAGGAVGG